MTPEGRAPAAPARAHTVGDAGLTAALRDLGIGEGEPEEALVFAAFGREAAGWDELEETLLEAFALSRRAMAGGAPIVYALDGAALYGHADPAAASLATGLLGGVRSLAAEGARHGIPAHAVTAAPDTDPAEVARAVAWLLGDGVGTGQLVHCDTAHLGRPAT